MASTFGTVILVVTVIAALLTFSRFFQPFAVLREASRTGGRAIDHAEDRELHELPDSMQNDPPIQHRPLRGRA